MKTFYHFITISIVFTSIFSCKKETFNHSDVDKLPESCSCCELADKIPGTYIGHYVERQYHSTPLNWSVIKDTILTFQVSRVWDNNFTDSLTCKFNIEYLYSDEVKLIDSTGRIYGVSSYSSSHFIEDNDTIKLRLMKTQYINHVSSGTTLNFTAVKQ